MAIEVSVGSFVFLRLSGSNSDLKIVGEQKIGFGHRLMLLTFSNIADVKFRVFSFHFGLESRPDKLNPKSWVFGEMSWSGALSPVGPRDGTLTRTLLEGRQGG